MLLLITLFPSRVKIFYAAHAILMCTMFVDMPRPTEAARLEILRKSGKEWYRLSQSIDASSQSHHKPSFLSRENLVSQPTAQALPLVDPLSLMRSESNPRNRPLTAEDYKSFADNPTTLSDRHFLPGRRRGPRLLVPSDRSEV
jgi:hypothetical protein